MNYGPVDKEMNGIQTTGSDEFEREASSRQYPEKFLNNPPYTTNQGFSGSHGRANSGANRGQLGHGNMHLDDESIVFEEDRPHGLKLEGSNKERGSTSLTNQSLEIEDLPRAQKNNSRVRYLSKRDFKELFKFEENDRDKRDLKKEFKAIDKKMKSRVQFKDFIGKPSSVFNKVYIDFYLCSSEMFAEALNCIDAKRVTAAISSRAQKSGKTFNENILKVLCINQAVEKMQRELNVLKEYKDHLIDKL